jgi:diguanylate cyclase (GGDEF)-like protein
MNRPSASVAAFSRSDALERAQLVRDFGEVLSSEAPPSRLWLRCCTLLASLMQSARVTIAVRENGADEVAYVYTGSAGSEPSERSIRAGSLPAQVLALGETVVRNQGKRFEVGVPIRFGRALFGAICMEDVAASDAEHVALLESCALYVGARLYHEDTIAGSERFAKLAFTDGLTGIANRRQFDEAFEREWSRAMRERVDLSLLMIDLDYFKSFNDTYGHQAGDFCLQKIAHALHDCVKRPTDLVARYGGEEFVAMLPGTDAAGATAMAEEMRAAVAALAVPHAGSSLEHISLSVGVSWDVPSPSRSPQALLQAADDALYRAKIGGRNRVYALGYQPETEAARPRRTATGNNLPLQLSRLIGRRDEIAHVCSLLDRHRLVSIVGTGGTGKTRVAVAAAEATAGRFADGAWFVDLSPITDPTLIASTIAAVFSADVSTDDAAAGALAAILESKDALLVIDNCEHLVADVATLTVALLRHCHKLTVLTTSREPLAVAGEAVYRLPLLSMPHPGENTTANALEYDAVALFVERATAAQRDFALTSDNVGDVLAVCRAVDAIALAIELAASRVGIVGLAQVRKHLAEFHLLTGGDRTALPRQRTMHAMIGWSYELLSAEERTLFARLSVFAGTFTFEAAAEVCAGAPVDGGDVFDLLSGLIRKSLVAADPGREGRYRLLDAVRAFARERLLEAGECDLVARRHAEYFEAAARRGDARMNSTPSREWMAALEPDVDNFRTALEWALDRRGDVSLGAALTAASMRFFTDFMPSEATRWIVKALDLLPRGTSPHVESRLCFGLTSSSRNLPAPRLRAAAERAIELSRETGDRRALSDALRGAAQIIGWYFREDRELADELACESIAIARELGDPIQLALALRTRGLTLDISNFPEKRAVLEESVALMRAHGNDRQMGNMLTWISDLEFSAGELERAFEYGLEAFRAAERSGSLELYTSAATNLANYACTLGDWETARYAATEALRTARTSSQHEGITFGVQAFPFLAAHAGDYACAARLIGFCDARCGVMHPQRQADQSEDLTYRALMTTLQRHLDEAALADAARSGAGMSEEQAVRLAESV